MKTVLRALVALLVLSLAVGQEACSTSCIRQTDCSSGEQCSAGTCLLIVTGEGGTVGPMTPGPSSSNTSEPRLVRWDAGSGSPTTQTDGSLDGR